MAGMPYVLRSVLIASWMITLVRDGLFEACRCSHHGFDRSAAPYRRMALRGVEARENRFAGAQLQIVMLPPPSQSAVLELTKA